MAGKKLESNFINMVGVLFTVCLVSSFLLGMVYNMTKDKIAAAKDAKKLAAIERVILSDYDNNPSSDLFKIVSHDGHSLECYPAKKGDTITSVAIKTFSDLGFSGRIGLMVGFLPDGKINKISVIEQMETPGLGTKIAGQKFKSQFEGKDPKTFKLKVRQDSGDIDAITAATISSRAFCDGVERAYQAYMKYKNQ